MTIDQTRITLGRDPSCDVVLPDRSVSPRHATIDISGPRPLLVDHHSTNGTWVAGTRIAPGRAKMLNAIEMLELGHFEVRVEWSVPVPPSAPDETAALARELLVRMRGRLPKERRLQILNGPSKGQMFELPTVGSVVIGRAETATLALADAEASREHSEILLEPNRAMVRDLGSKNGTELAQQGEPVCLRANSAPMVLVDGAEIRVGNTLLVFEDEAQRWHRELRAEGDEALPVAAPAPVIVVDETSAPSKAARTMPRFHFRVSTVEALLYALTALVLLASVAAILWLVRGA